MGSGLDPGAADVSTPGEEVTREAILEALVEQLCDHLAKAASVLARRAEKGWPPPGDDPWEERERIT